MRTHSQLHWSSPRSSTNENSTLFFTATLDIHANPLASKQDQHSTIISGLKPLDPTEGAPKQGVANLMLLHLFWMRHVSLLIKHAFADCACHRFSQRSIEQDIIMHGLVETMNCGLTVTCCTWLSPYGASASLVDTSTSLQPEWTPDVKCSGLLDTGLPVSMKSFGTILLFCSTSMALQHSRKVVFCSLWLLPPHACPMVDCCAILLISADLIFIFWTRRRFGRRGN